MELVYLGIVIFLFMLAVFDLLVGVSNDAVNFLNSAVGARVATFRTILIVASVGVFAGATMSNGMMDIARHGIFQPTYFTFYELMCIFLAVMVTDVVLLDVFNTLGMPTSTTVSMVFELLGGTFILALLKILADSTGMLSFGTLLNTEKALSVILGIFLSVAIAFIAGVVVQYISRLVFTFNYVKHLKWTIGIFGGIAATSLAYFILIKGLEMAPFMTPESLSWLDQNTAWLVGGCFVLFTVLMQVLHWCGVNVFKVIVLLGTFALALAFAGNDLVNFIGVPLAGYSSYLDYTANAGGADVHSFMMSSLESSAKTPFIFLFLAGLIMVYALATSKKAHNVIKTSVDLARQEEGEEMFGSSPMARLIVRHFRAAAEWVQRYTPKPVAAWIDSRFNKDEMIIQNGAAFDLVRAAVNLVLAGLLIIFGTNMKLPLSTTYVTFIVAMGTSLADRAWSRESAVYRITGVLSVIGGWFLTAFVAFTVCALITLLMFYGGVVVMVLLIAVAVFLLVRSNIAYGKKVKEEKGDALFARILASKDKAQTWGLLKQHVAEGQVRQLEASMTEYDGIIDGIIGRNLRLLRRTLKQINRHKEDIRKLRQKEMVGLRRIDTTVAIERNTWFHLSTNAVQQVMYCLRRMADPCKEHVDNNFTPLSDADCANLGRVRSQVDAYMRQAQAIIRDGDFTAVEHFLADVEAYKGELSRLRKELLDQMQDEGTNLRTSLVLLNLLQESQELLSSLRHLIRGFYKFVH